MKIGSRRLLNRVLLLLVCPACLVVVVLWGFMDARLLRSDAVVADAQRNHRPHRPQHHRHHDDAFPSDGGEVTAVRGRHVLRNVLLFGDSLTAGAFYEERHGKLLLRTVNWARTVEEALCAMQRNHDAATRGGLAPTLKCDGIRVVARGFPGKDSKALAQKLRRILINERHRTSSPSSAAKPGKATEAERRVSPFSLVVIMSGTNDVVGLRNALTTADIVGMHRMVRRINCGGGAGGGGRNHNYNTSIRSSPPSVMAPQHERCGSVALLMPPLNYSLSRAWYGQHLPRGYCEGKSAVPAVASALHRRRTDLNAMISQDPWLSACAFDWDAHGLSHRDPSDVRAMWSDCLHPNAGEMPPRTTT